MAIRPKQYIKNLPALQEFECTVCFEIQITMMRCSGPCKAALCLQCASIFCKAGEESSCPKRCSTPLLLQNIPNFNPQFHCPYAGKKCEEKAMGMDEFSQHCRQCEDAPIQVIEQNLRKEEYVCMKGHQLLFLDPASSYFAFQDNQNIFSCAGCGEKQLCNSFCPKCSQPEERVCYCNKCRTLPCTRDTCPIGHELEKIEVENRNFTCDLCGFVIILFSKYSYSDRNCNFDICERCFQHLPENHPLVPLQTNLLFIQYHKPIYQLALNYFVEQQPQEEEQQQEAEQQQEVNSQENVDGDMSESSHEQQKQSNEPDQNEQADNEQEWSAEESDDDAEEVQKQKIQNKQIKQQEAIPNQKRQKIDEKLEVKQKE